MQSDFVHAAKKVPCVLKCLQSICFVRPYRLGGHEYFAQTLPLSGESVLIYVWGHLELMQESISSFKILVFKLGGMCFGA